MDTDRDVLYFKMQLLQAEIAMNGMVAENKQREMQGDSMAYTEKDFVNLNVESVEAKLEDGILILVAPKQSKGVKIDIQ